MDYPSRDRKEVLTNYITLSFLDMKTLSIEEMEATQAGFTGCSNAEALAFTAGAAVAGALFFGVGGIVAGYTALAYWTMRCPNGSAAAM